MAEAWRKLDVAVVGIGRKLDPTYLAGVPAGRDPTTRASGALVRERRLLPLLCRGSEALEEEHDARLIAASRDEFVDGYRWL